MATSAQMQKNQRAARVKLGGSVVALILLENGRSVRSKLHQLSVTGGLLHLAKPLDEGIKVELLFHVAATAVRTKVKILFPSSATNGWLQPFRFVDLSDEERSTLSTALQSLLQPVASGS